LAPGQKALNVGLLDKGSEAPYHSGQDYTVTNPATDAALTAVAPAMSGLVINATWDQLELIQGQFTFGVIDQSLAAVAAWNASHPANLLGARLRVFAAYRAPDWAKTLDGPAIDTMDGQNPATVGEWWGPNYRAAWAALQAALSTAYDDNAVLLDVAVSSCAASTAEPMVIDTDTLKVATMQGYTTTTEHDCLIGAFADYAGWKKTAIYFPMNPIAGDPTIAPDIISRCASSASTGGPSCILANNALNPGAAQTGSKLADVYQAIHAAYQMNPHQTIGFQMDGPTTSTWCGAMQVAVTYNARSVELWPTYDTVAPATLESWSQALAAGSGPSCP
jgi:hypothetical protein